MTRPPDEEREDMRRGKTEELRPSRPSLRAQVMERQQIEALINTGRGGKQELFAVGLVCCVL